MKRTIFSETFNAFAGAGFAAEPGAGQLDSDIWSVDGFNSPDDDARGTTDGGTGQGGLYAVTRSAGDNGLLIQPGGSDWTPGTLTAKLNAGATALNGVTLTFDRLVNNDTDRANSFDVSVSLDGTTFEPLDTFTSGEIRDTLGVTSQTVTVTLPDLAAGQDVFLRWSGDDVSGGGARDEFGLDNIVVEGTEGEAPPPSIVINEVLASTTGADSEYGSCSARRAPRSRASASSASRATIRTTTARSSSGTISPTIRPWATTGSSCWRTRRPRRPTA